MKLTIKITKEVLERSSVCIGLVGQNCAIAKAICDIFPYSWTGRHEISLFTDERNMKTCSPFAEVPLPAEATSFIWDFDRLSPAERLLMPEMQFTIEVPDSVIESIGIEEAKAIIEKSSTLELA